MEPTWGHVGLICFKSAEALGLRACRCAHSYPRSSILIVTINKNFNKSPPKGGVGAPPYPPQGPGPEPCWRVGATRDPKTASKKCGFPKVFATFSLLGRSWAIFVDLGPIFGLSLAILAQFPRSWAILGPFGSHLGRSWGRFGAVLELFWGRFGAIFPASPPGVLSFGVLSLCSIIFTRSLAHLGPSSAILGWPGATMGCFGAT